jgi:hypothetical protein
MEPNNQRDNDKAVLPEYQRQIKAETKNIAKHNSNNHRTRKNKSLSTQV